MSQPPKAEILFKDWEKYFLPVLQEHTIPSSIFYCWRDTLDFSSGTQGKVLNIRTHMNGFEVCTYVSEETIIEMYKDKETAVDLEAPREITGNELMDKFNHDYMDGRGIPENPTYQ